MVIETNWSTRGDSDWTPPLGAPLRGFLQANNATVFSGNVFFQPDSMMQESRVALPSTACAPCGPYFCFLYSVDPEDVFVSDIINLVVLVFVIHVHPFTFPGSVALPDEILTWRRVALNIYLLQKL